MSAPPAAGSMGLSGSASSTTHTQSPVSSVTTHLSQAGGASVQNQAGENTFATGFPSQSVNPFAAAAAASSTGSSNTFGSSCGTKRGTMPEPERESAIMESVILEEPSGMIEDTAEILEEVFKERYFDLISQTI